MSRVSPDQMREFAELAHRMTQLHSELSDEKVTRAAIHETAEYRSAWVRALLYSRTQLIEVIGPGLFADPAFDLLLDLFASEEEGKVVNVSAACEKSGVPHTTALRWIALLISRGLAEKHNDPYDGRQIFLQLTTKASDAVRSWITSTAAVGLHLD